MASRAPSIAEAMTLEQLARELADRNERCGHCESEQICLRPVNHKDAHQHEPISRVIPIR